MTAGSSCAWERHWLCQASGDDFVDQLEPGDHTARTEMDGLFQRPKTTLTPISPSPTEHTQRTLILRHIRACDRSKISFSYLYDYARSVEIDGDKLAQIVTDLVHLGHVALIDEGHGSGFSFVALRNFPGRKSRPTKMRSAEEV
jgi:hypothetical protein